MLNSLKNIENTSYIINNTSYKEMNLKNKVIIHYNSYILIEDIHFKYDNTISYEDNFKKIIEQITFD